MPPFQAIDVLPPVAGLHRGVGYQQEAPYFYSDGNNLFPRDVFEGRERLGSRPGLVKAFPAGVTGPCHLLANVRVVETTGETTYLQQFGPALGSQWEIARWKERGVSIDPRGWAFVYAISGQLPNDGANVLFSLAIDTATTSIVSLGILDDGTTDGVGTGRATGTYSVFARLLNANPNLLASGGAEAQIDFTVPGSPVLRLHFYSATGVKTSYASAVSGSFGFPGKLELRITGADVCTADIAFTGPSAGTQIQKSDPNFTAVSTRQRFGFGINGTLESALNTVRMRRANFFKVTYNGTPPSPNRNIVCAVGGTNASVVSAGKAHFVFEDTPGTLTEPSAHTVINTGVDSGPRHLQAAELFGKLYVVGEAEAIWEFIPTGSGTLALAVASAGTMPANCTVIAAWRGRLCVVSRTVPSVPETAAQTGGLHNISMSKVGAPLDWSYTALPVGSAVKLNTTGIDTGRLAEPINALIAHSDDYMVIGALNSLHVLRGDPTYGGQIDRLSSSIGIVAPQAHARGPNGETVILTTDGLYGIPAQISGFPESISRERLPQELRDIDVNNNRILMAYDVRNRGVFIGITPILGSGGTYFWLDWQRRGYHLLSFNASHEPTALAYRTADSPLDQHLLFGCRDGHIRTFNDNAFSDDGVPYKARLLIGPIALGGGGYNDGMLREVVGQTGL